MPEPMREDLPKIMADVYAILEPLDPDARRRVIAAAMLLLAEEAPEKEAPDA